MKGSNEDHYSVPVNSPVRGRKRSFSSTLSFSSYHESMILESKPEPGEEDWLDKLIFIMTRKRRQLLIDSDGQSQLISVEESENRLWYLNLGFALVLWITANILAGCFIAARIGSSPTVIFTNPELPTGAKFFTPLSPQIALINKLGHGEVFKYSILKNQTLMATWSIKLPFKHNDPVDSWMVYPWIQEYSLNFYGYNDLQNLYITPFFKESKMTVIHANNTHRTVPKSALKSKVMNSPRVVVRTSKYLWLLDGCDPQLHHALHPCRTGSRLWSIKRHRWLKGPTLPYAVFDGCGVSMNRTHAQLFIIPATQSDTNCIDKWIYNFEIEKWKLTQECFLKMIENFHTSNNGQMLSCTAIFNKHQKM